MWQIQNHKDCFNRILSFSATISYIYNLIIIVTKINPPDLYYRNVAIVYLSSVGSKNDFKLLSQLCALLYISLGTKILLNLLAMITLSAVCYVVCHKNIIWVLYSIRIVYNRNDNGICDDYCKIFYKKSSNFTYIIWDDHPYATLR